MRFDLEFKIVSRLTQTGLDTLSEMLYGISNITPMLWDENTVTSRANINTGSINFSTYNRQKNLDDIYFSSGVEEGTDALKQVDSIIYGSSVIPVFNSGIYTTNKSKFIWSKNNIIKPFEFNGKRYVCEIGEDAEISNIFISTFALELPGFTKNKKEFINTKWDDIYYQGQLISDPANAIENTLVHIFKLNSLADYKYCIYLGTIYLSCEEIKYRSHQIGLVSNQQNNIFTLPEFPIKNLILQGYTEGVDYTVRSGIIIFKKSTILSYQASLLANFDIVPTLSYIDAKRNISFDKVFFNANMHPRLINYKNGTLCLSNSYGDASVPLNLSVSVDKDIVYGAEQFKLKALIKGAGDTPISDKKVTLKILTNNATFIDNNQAELERTSFADGSIPGEIVSRLDRLGMYLQKEWVSGNKIRVPYEIANIDSDGVYLYFITDDDPILGSRYNALVNTVFEETFSGDNPEGYSMNGRKIAYVSLQDSNDTLISRFIKPIDITYTYDQITPYRNETGAHTYNAPVMTEITFEKTIPNADNIVGFWLITDGVIKVQATYSDDDVDLASEILSVNLQNIKTENSFILNKYNTSLGASQLSTFGYLTISEYLKNPFGLNSVAMYCMHSDCIYKRCIHPDLAIRSNFILDEGKIGCIHNSTWDSENTICPAQAAHLVNPFIMQLEG